ncbi:MAG: pyridoxamine 5'-phosphate oxidase family protein [Opitutaceae bacterium]|nr:pyridoxamine 5'-phosphate oxidase family protein [Opitutaceae bacterium]
MSHELIQTLRTYIAATRWATLATVREDGAPAVRTIGGFAPAGDDTTDVYFSTARATSKNQHIARNPVVNFFFQHEGQELAAFKNVALLGQAAEVFPGSPAYQQAVDTLSARNPRFKAKAATGDLNDTAIYKVRAKEIRYTDLARGIGPAAIIELAFNPAPT